LNNPGDQDKQFIDEINELKSKNKFFKSYITELESKIFDEKQFVDCQTQADPESEQIEIERLHQKLTKIKAKCKQLIDENEKFKCQMKSAENFSSQQPLVSPLNQNSADIHDDMKQQIIKLTNDLACKENELKITNKEITALNNSLMNLKDTLDNKKSEIESKNQEIENYKAQQIQTEHQIMNNNFKIRQKDGEIQEIVENTQKINQLQKEHSILRDIQKQNDELRNQITQLQQLLISEKQIFIAQTSVLKEEMENEITSMQATIMNTVEDKQKLNVHVIDLEKRVLLLSSRGEEKIEKIKELTAIIRQMDDLLAQAVGLKTENYGLKSEIEEQRCSLNDLKEKQSNKKHEFDSLMIELNGLKEKLIELENTKLELNAQIEVNGKENQRMAAQILDLKKQLNVEDECSNSIMKPKNEPSFVKVDTQALHEIHAELDEKREYPVQFKSNIDSFIENNNEIEHYEDYSIKLGSMVKLNDIHKAENTNDNMVRDDIIQEVCKNTELNTRAILENNQSVQEKKEIVLENIGTLKLANEQLENDLFCLQEMNTLLLNNLLQWQSANQELESKVLESQETNKNLIDTCKTQDMQILYIEACEQVKILQTQVESLIIQNAVFKDCEVKMMSMEKTIVDLQTQQNKDLQALNEKNEELFGQNAILKQFYIRKDELEEEVELLTRDLNLKNDELKCFGIQLEESQNNQISKTGELLISHERTKCVEEENRKLIEANFKLEEDLFKNQAVVNGLMTDIALLNEKLMKKENTLMELQQSYIQWQAYAQTMTQQLETKNTEFTEVAAKLKKMDELEATVEILNDRLERKNIKANELNNSTIGLNTTIENLKSQIDELTEKNNQITIKLSQKDAEIDELTDRLNNEELKLADLNTEMSLYLKNDDDQRLSQCVTPIQPQNLNDIDYLRRKCLKLETQLNKFHFICEKVFLKLNKLKMQNLNLNEKIKSIRFNPSNI
jgi:chromosome segregation ATPase